MIIKALGHIGPAMGMAARMGRRGEQGGNVFCTS